MRVIWLRVVVAILLLATVAIAAVPLLVLLDLSNGGSGYGLCGDLVTDCRAPFTAGPELLLGLTVALFGLVAVLRIILRLARRMERRAQLAQFSARP